VTHTSRQKRHFGITFYHTLLLEANKPGGPFWLIFRTKKVDFQVSKGTKGVIELLSTIIKEGKVVIFV